MKMRKTAAMTKKIANLAAVARILRTIVIIGLMIMATTLSGFIMMTLCGAEKVSIGEAEIQLELGFKFFAAALIVLGYVIVNILVVALAGGSSKQLFGVRRSRSLAYDIGYDDSRKRLPTDAISNALSYKIFRTGSIAGAIALVLGVNFMCDIESFQKKKWLLDVVHGVLNCTATLNVLFMLILLTYLGIMKIQFARLIRSAQVTRSKDVSRASLRITRSKIGGLIHSLRRFSFRRKSRFSTHLFRR